MFAKKICTKNEKLYIMFFRRTCGICFRKTCAIRFLMSKAFQKAKFYQNLTSGSGSKQRFTLLHEKAVIQAVYLRTQAGIVLKPGFRPKGRALGM